MTVKELKEMSNHELDWYYEEPGSDPDDYELTDLAWKCLASELVEIWEEEMRDAGYSKDFVSDFSKSDLRSWANGQINRWKKGIKEGFRGAGYEEDLDKGYYRYTYDVPNTVMVRAENPWIPYHF
ncbi:MAG: hypothetical protein MJZ37_00235 [Bacilli bacterium]|nr:hypothetical protein [Bacilli bacterium]